MTQRSAGSREANGTARRRHGFDSGHEERESERPSVLGAYIRAQRQLADLSLRQLATLSNVSNAYLSQVERGLHQPSLKVLRSIADALDISTEHMLAQAGGGTASEDSEAKTADAHRPDEREETPLAISSVILAEALVGIHARHEQHPGLGGSRRRKARRIHRRHRRPPDT